MAILDLVIMPPHFLGYIWTQVPVLVDVGRLPSADGRPGVV